MAERAGLTDGRAAGRASPETTPSRLSDLLEVGRSLASTPSLKVAMGRVLDMLHERHGTLSSGIMLLDEATGELSIEAGTGFDWETARRTRYRPGEGIIGLVVQSGRPIVVPRVSHEPLFLNRTGIYDGGRRSEITYICVPVAVDSKPAGALGVSLPYAAREDLDEEARFFGVVAAMLGQAVRVHRLVELERDRLLVENRKLRQELAERYEVSNIVGNSRQMRDLYQQLAQVATTNTTVLIRGESGTGKEMIAHAIHYGSPRADKPFVKVSCAALPESLIESELFGHEAGAFTSARAQKKGRFELAHGGTLFLDEVGELSLATQVKLLRVLQEWEFERLGGVEPIKVNVRLIAATNKDLERAVKEGALREDLYYRLDVFSLCLPPLRERRSDILLLIDHFVEKYAAEHGKSIKRVSTTAIDAMMSYHWPGNVRELESCVERAVLVCEGGALQAHHLPPTLQTAEISGTLADGSLAAAVEALERDIIVDALKTARGNRARAARMLSATERVVGYKIKKYGLDCARFKTPRGRRR